MRILEPPREAPRGGGCKYSSGANARKRPKLFTNACKTPRYEATLRVRARVCVHSQPNTHMKRAPEADAGAPLIDPVLAQLDALINGTSPPPVAKAPRTDEVAPNPVLAQLDALINPGTATTTTTTCPPAILVTPVALVLPQPPLLSPLLPEPELEPVPRGPPGLLREFGGVRGYMASLSLRADAQDAPASAGL